MSDIYVFAFNGNSKTLAFRLAAGLAILLIVRGVAELI